MNAKEIKELFFNKMKDVCDDDETESLFYILVEEIHDMKRIDWVLNADSELNKEQIDQWNFYTQQLQSHKPIQYIIGKTEFFGLPFFVNEHTLIPRPETEELVDWILEVESRKSKVEREKAKGESSNPQNPKPKTQHPIKILDIGTGTGCIAISLAKNIKGAIVYALDVSNDTLEIARKNATQNEVEINFIQQNILEVNPNSNFRLPNSVDIIVSNPPYVRDLEKEEIKPNVLEFEPHLALFVPNDDALIFYQKIAQIAQEILAPNGLLFFEINQYLGKETVDLLQNLGFKNIILKQDLLGNDRMICCKKG